MKYLITYEKTSTGYSAYAPDLPGCIAAGFSFEETAELMRGAVDASHEKFAGREDSAPFILRRAYEDLQDRWRKASLREIAEGRGNERVLSPLALTHFGGAQTVAQLQVPVADASPAIFAADGSGAGPGAILNQDPPGVDGQIAAATLPKPLLPTALPRHIC